MQVSRRASRRALLVVVILMLTVLATHLVLAWQLDTSHMQRRLEQAVARGTDSLYVVRIGSSHMSLLGRSFRISDFEFYPDTAAFRRRKERGQYVHHTRYLVTARSISLDGLGVLRFLRRQLWASLATIDSMRMEIEVDRNLPRGPLVPSTLPHQALRNSRLYQLGEIRLTRSSVTFFERAADGTRFGRLPFTNLEGTFRHATNDPLRMSIAAPCEIDLRARFAGASNLIARFNYDLAASGLNLGYRVSFGPMDAKALNPFLVDLEGIRIRDGRLDSAVLTADVRDDLATGKLMLRYHDLAIETLDKVDRDRSLKDKIQTFFFNTFKLRDSNPDGDEAPIVATLRRRRAPETPLFKFIWLTLRDGVLQTIGV